jgi:hypothetical protein
MVMARVVLAGVAALGAVVGVAPVAAHASTTTACGNGITTTIGPSLITFGTSCSGFSDAGGPYVFDIGTLSELLVPVPPGGHQQTYIYDNVVATCTGYNTSPIFQGTGCTWTP